MVGHAPNVDWFCATHADAAAALVECTIDVAMRNLTATQRAAPTTAQRVAPPAAPRLQKRDVKKLPIDPREIDDVVVLFRDRMAALVGDPGAVATTTTRRTWSVMDGCRPPHCPFEDIDTTTMTGPLGEAELTWDRAMWNDDDAARRSATLAVTPAGGDRCAVGASVGAGFPGSVGSAATEILVIGEPGADLQSLIDELVSENP